MDASYIYDTSGNGHDLTNSGLTQTTSVFSAGGPNAIALTADAADNHATLTGITDYPNPCGYGTDQDNYASLTICFCLHFGDATSNTFHIYDDGNLDIWVNNGRLTLTGSGILDEEIYDFSDSSRWIFGKAYVVISVNAGSTNAHWVHAYVFDEGYTDGSLEDGGEVYGTVATISVWNPTTTLTIGDSHESIVVEPQIANVCVVGGIGTLNEEQRISWALSGDPFLPPPIYASSGETEDNSLPTFDSEGELNENASVSSTANLTFPKFEATGHAWKTEYFNSGSRLEFPFFKISASGDHYATGEATLPGLSVSGSATIGSVISSHGVGRLEPFDSSGMAFLQGVFTGAAELKHLTASGVARNTQFFKGVGRLKRLSVSGSADISHLTANIASELPRAKGRGRLR